MRTAYKVANTRVYRSGPMLDPSEDRVTVLVVDDDPQVRKSVGSLLSADGYDVAYAADGETAVEMCGQNRYDAVLSDLRMPGIDGIETFRQLRALQADLPLILMSADISDRERQKAREAGASALLDKPFHAAPLLELIAQATGGGSPR